MIEIKKVIVIGIALFFTCCDKKNEVVNPEKTHKTVIQTDKGLDYHERYFKKLRNKTDKIEISLYKIKNDYYADTTKLLKSYRILDKNKLKKFDLWFKSARNKGYCCCPRVHYILDLYDQKTKLKRFYVDTLKEKDKAFIYDTSFQTSYIIPLTDWNNFLKDN